MTPCRRPDDGGSFRPAGERIVTFARPGKPLEIGFLDRIGPHSPGATPEGRGAGRNGF